MEARYILNCTKQVLYMAIQDNYSNDLIQEIFDYLKNHAVDNKYLDELKQNLEDQENLILNAVRDSRGNPTHISLTTDANLKNVIDNLADRLLYLQTENRGDTTMAFTSIADAMRVLEQRLGGNGFIDNAMKSTQNMMVHQKAIRITGENLRLGPNGYQIVQDKSLLANDKGLVKAINTRNVKDDHTLDKALQILDGTGEETKIKDSIIDAAKVKRNANYGNYLYNLHGKSAVGNTIQALQEHVERLGKSGSRGSREDLVNAYREQERLLALYGQRATESPELARLRVFKTRADELKSKYGETVDTFEAQKKKSEDREEREGFISTLLKGMREIFGKNPLYDLLRWGFLWLGKNHPVLAAIGLALPMLLGPIRGLFTLIKAGNKGLQFLFNAGKNTVAAFGKGGIARNTAAWGLRNIRNIPGVGRGLASGLVKGGSKLLGPFATLVDFGINKKVKGQSTGEAATRAVGSGLGWLGGAALGGLLTPILGPLGPILGGAIGSTLGDMLAGWMFPMLSKIGGGIADVGKTMGNMWTSFKEQHPILSRLLTIVNPVLGIFDFFKTLLDHLPWTKDRNKGDVQTGTTYKNGQVYGDPIVTNNTVAVLTPEERKKREEKYKKDLEYYNSVATDDYLNKSSYSVTFGKWMTGRENMLERNKIKYAESQLSKGMWAPNSLARAQERAKLIASPEAQAYAEKTLNAYLVGEGDRLKRERDFLDSSIGVDSKYGSIPSSFKTEKINGVDAVNLHQLGIGGIIKGDSYANNFIGAGRVNRMKELDSVFAKYGVGYKITSTMGDAHAGGAKSHYAGNKLDIVPTGNLDARTKSQLERELRQRGFYNGNTGAVGWHNAGSGYHWDLSLLTSNELKTMGKTLSSTQKAVATATATQEETATSVATASNGLRQSVFDRVYGKDSSLAKAREIIFTATDVTGSLGVWGITQVNNTGRMRT